jgi:SAM-dependent methyltransferase
MIQSSEKHLLVNSISSYPTAEMLEMPRAKPRSIVVSLGYKLVLVGKTLLGKELVLRFCLKGSWLLSRFAFEVSGEIYGNDFQKQARVLNEDLLKNWIPPNGSVLDVGCGVGRWCRMAANYAGKVVGVDYDQTLIETAKKDFAAPNITYWVGDVTKDLADQKFDVALLIHVIEHIENYRQMLLELKKIASTLIVEVPDFESNSLNWARLKVKSPFFSDGDHIREYTLKILLDQLEAAGWIPQHYEKNGGAVLVVARQVSDVSKDE